MLKQKNGNDFGEKMIKVELTFEDTYELTDFFSMLSSAKTVEKVEKCENIWGIDEDTDAEAIYSPAIDSQTDSIFFDQESFNKTYDYDAISCTFKTKKGKSRFWVTGTEGLDILLYWDEGLSAPQIYDRMEWNEPKKVTQNTVSHFIRRCKEGKMYWAFRNICENPLMNEDFSKYEKILMKMKEE